MKIIHTADWHLGQTFYQNDRGHEHQAFLAWLKETLHQQQIDVLLIAGDVFDNPNPSASAQKMFYHFLKEVTNQNNQLQVVVIAGNHDSAARLEAPIPLLEDMNVTVRGVIKRSAEGTIDYHDLLVPLYNRQGERKGWCLAVPYLRQGDHPPVDNANNGHSYAEGIKAFYAEAIEAAQREAQPGEAIFAMGHLQASGMQTNTGDESERNLIGGVEGVDGADLFPPNIIYTALGHLHRAQRVAGRENIRYSGSPLPMSFAEENYQHGVTLVEIEGDQVKSIEKLAFEPPVKLISIPQKQEPLQEGQTNNLPKVLQQLKQLPQGEADRFAPYLQVRVAFKETIPNLRQEIEKALEGHYARLARIVTDNANRFDESEAMAVTFENLQTIEPLEMARLAFRRKNLQMPNDLETLFNQVLEEINHQQN
ncbi:MAG: exonuclease SbcCD subunit D [Breznakibacter sp.]